ncbi:MAG: PAS domain S-box protein [Anaerolineae bacterium]
MRDYIRVLLIDDERMQYDFVEGLLSHIMGSNFTLDWVTTPRACLDVLKTQTYDVFLLDYDLKKYTALDFLQLFQERNIATPVIVTTGHGSFDIDVSVMNAGAFDFLDKVDLNVRTLERAIRYAIEHAEILDRLRQNEQRFRAMVEKGSDLIIQLDVDGQIIYVSPSVSRLLGCADADLIGKPLTDYVHPNDLPNLAQMLEQLITGSDSPPLGTYRVRAQFDEFVWFEFIGTNLLHVAGIEAIVINGRDISERQKRLEAERTQLVIAESLLDSSIALNTTLNFDDVVSRILENVGSIIPHQSANVMIIDEDGFTQVRAAHDYDRYGHQDDTGFVFNVRTTPTFATMLANKRPLLINNVAQSDLWTWRASDMPLQSYLSAPILEQDQVIGFINLESSVANQFTDNHVEYIQLFAFLASIAITNARAYQQVQQLAALEERQRLARELHDAVSQTLFSASVIADSLTKSDFSDTQKLMTGITKINQLNRGALAEMRSLLVELRPQAIVNSPLSDLITTLCNGIQGRANLDVQVQVVGEFDVLAADVQLQLYRITQEILNNIHKHARATLVNVELRKQNGQIDIVIADDGIGFDLNTGQADHHGITIMRERAEKIGASLQIDTSTDEGTYVHVTWCE